jgi:hypothetical protein
MKAAYEFLQYIERYKFSVLFLLILCECYNFLDKLTQIENTKCLMNPTYSSKKSFDKTQYSAFSSNLSTSKNKSIDFGRFQYEREDFNYNDKAPKFKKFTESNRGS